MSVMASQIASNAEYVPFDDVIICVIPMMPGNMKEFIPNVKSDSQFYFKGSERVLPKFIRVIN